MSGWNSCGVSGREKLGTGSKWELKDLTSGEVVSSSSSWTLMAADGSGCGPADHEQTTVQYAQTILTNETIPAGTTRTLALTVDTTGASSSQDDSIRVDLPAEPPTPLPLINSIDWYDDTTLADGTNVKNLTVNGGTLVY